MKSANYVLESYRRNTFRQSRKKRNRWADEVAKSSALRRGVDPAKAHCIQRCR